MTISSTFIKSVQDILRQDAGVDGDAQRISQLSWLLFLKIFDDQETELELLRDTFCSPLPERLRWRTWAADPEGITGEELLEFVNGDLFPTLKGLDANEKRSPRGFVVREVFGDAYNYMKSGQLLRQVINRINEIDFNNRTERHLFNDLYEKILKDLQNAGNAGEFYTPRAVTQFMVDQVNPRLGERVLDPACGTGGFLACAIEHLKPQRQRADDDIVLQNAITGVEKKQLPHLLCVTNMMLHGIEVPSQIRHDNTLSRPLVDYGNRDLVDVILTNPPFGGTEEPGIEANFPADVRTRETADLFLVLLIELLKHNGARRGAARRHALWRGREEPHQGKAPHRVQPAHHRAAAQRRVCTLHRYQDQPAVLYQGTPTREVWYYEHPYPAGYKSYSKTKPIRIEEFAPEKAWWGSEADGFASRVENEFAWKVSIETLKANGYNLDQKNPHRGEEISHDPDELLAQYGRLTAEAQALRDQLKGILAEALEGRA